MLMCLFCDTSKCFSQISHFTSSQILGLGEFQKKMVTFANICLILLRK